MTRENPVIEDMGRTSGWENDSNQPNPQPERSSDRETANLGMSYAPVRVLDAAHGVDFSQSIRPRPVEEWTNGRRAPADLIMITESEIQPNTSSEATRRVSRVEALLDYAALGCLLAGALAIIKSLQMHQVVDALVCLPASVGACSLICYLYFRKE